MDILSTDTKAVANEGATIELRDPAGAPLLHEGEPVTINVLGADSDLYTQISNGITNRNIRNRSKGIGQITAESALTDQIVLLSRVMTGWNGIGIGEPVTPFSADAAQKLLRVNYIREQVEQFISDRGNFLKASPAS